MYILTVIMLVSFENTLIEKEKQAFNQLMLQSEETLEQRFSSIIHTTQLNTSFISQSYYFELFFDTAEDSGTLPIFRNGLEKYIESNEDIYGLVIFIPGEPPIVTNKLMEETAIFNQLTSIKEEDYLRFSYQFTDIISTPDLDIITYMEPIYGINTDPDTPLAYYMSVYDLSTTFQAYDIHKDNDTFLIIYENGLPKHHNFDTGIDPDTLSSIYSKDHSTFISFQDEDYFIQHNNAQVLPWRITMLKSRSSMRRDILALYPVSSFYFVILLAYFSLTAHVVVTSITGPVNSLIGQMDAIDINDPGHRLTNVSRNEINDITTHINGLLHRIQEGNTALINEREKLYQTELSKSEAELAFLHSQINPHFLYNTLECIRIIAAENQVDDIEAITVSMGDIFRYAVTAPNTLTLEEELKCAVDYFTIMDLRYPGYYRLVLDIGEDILTHPVQKMTLQPILENIFKHGFKGKRKKGIVHIAITSDNESLNIRVTDTGIGMSQDSVLALNHSLTGLDDYPTDHIGLKNIAWRYHLIHGDLAKLQIKSKENHYTSVLLTYPL